MRIEFDLNERDVEWFRIFSKQFLANYDIQGLSYLKDLYET